MGGVTPPDWLHFIISLLCNDIGYVRGICQGDGNGFYVTNLAGEKTSLSKGSTDAAMTPYHVARSKLFRERFSHWQRQQLPHAGAASRASCHLGLDHPLYSFLPLRIPGLIFKVRRH